jgi:hypothetical protein
MVTDPFYTLSSQDTYATGLFDEKSLELLKDARTVVLAEAGDRVKTKRRGPPMSTYASGQKSYPLRPRRR